MNIVSECVPRSCLVTVSATASELLFLVRSRDPLQHMEQSPCVDDLMREWGSTNLSRSASIPPSMYIGRGQLFGPPKHLILQFLEILDPWAIFFACLLVTGGYGF